MLDEASTFADAEAFASMSFASIFVDSEAFTSIPFA
jgi:hypothetical protein